MTREPIAIDDTNDVRGRPQTSDAPVPVDTAQPTARPATSPPAAPTIDGGDDQASADSRSDIEATRTPVPPPGRRPISAAKQQANRENARHSSGPSPAGKHRSRWNALRDGLFAKSAVIATGLLRENPEDFQRLHTALRRDLKPEGTAEEILVEKIAMCYWRHARVVKFESSQIDLAMRSPAAELQRMMYGQPADKALSMEMPPARLDEMILRREALTDRQLYRALHELERRQRGRRGDDVKPPTAHV
jgi:hypothetical protein